MVDSMEWTNTLTLYAQVDWLSPKPESCKNFRTTVACILFILFLTIILFTFLEEEQQPQQPAAETGEVYYISTCFYCIDPVMTKRVGKWVLSLLTSLLVHVYSQMKQFAVVSHIDKHRGIVIVYEPLQ